MAYTYCVGSSGEDVRLIQGELLQRRLLSTEPDGLFGADTEAAVRAFQRSVKLPDTGVVDAQTRAQLWPRAGELFEEVLHKELAAIHEAREGGGAAPERNALEGADAAMLTGLAFSGGGIRSATFNLGVLQGLAELGLLRRFDYLSTVSGGGYIGSWFSALLHRSFAGVPDPARRAEPCLTAGTPSAPREVEPSALRFLRRYSNYLTPRAGFFSADTWAAVATYVRNFMLNQCILLSLCALLLLMPRLAAFVGARLGALPAHWAWVTFLFAAAAALITFSVYGGGNSAKRAAAAKSFLRWSPLLIGVLLLSASYLAAFSFAEDFMPGRIERPWHVVVLGMPVVLAAFGTIVVLALGLLGHRVEEETREWWSRLGGWLMIWALAWLVVFGAAIYGPYAVYAFESWAAGLSVAWVVTTVGGVLAGRSPTTTGKDGKAAGAGPWWQEALARIAPYVFIAGLLLAVATVLQGMLSPPADLNASAASCALGDLFGANGCEPYFQALSDSGARLGLAFLVLIPLALVFCWRIDVNLFSLHAFYRNRLVRCYLGASNPDRRPHPFTGFDENDNFPLADLAGAPGSVACQRPIHILNTALNLTTGTNLAWQERKAAAFAMTPLYCGYQFPSGATACAPCYQPTRDFLKTRKRAYLSLGSAMAISGAAANPNHGYHSSPAVAFLMTVFNVRLGWWLPNPRYGENWRADRLRRYQGVAAFYLLQELFGMSDDRSHYVCLSDGGHFENLGIYELVRRRCRFIVASDADEDGAFEFEDLANAIRKCYVDFGVRIDIDTRPLVPQGEGKASLQHCVVGTIRYDLTVPGAMPGVLLYVKPSLTGNEATDIRQYASQHARFPHETTHDQWFTESQFESYRKLGQHIARTVFDAAREPAGRLPATETLFVRLRERWHAPSGIRDGAFAKHARELSDILETIRKDPNLRFLDGQVYAEYHRIPRPGGAPQSVEYWIPHGDDELRAGFYVCNRMVQLLESVYLDLDLEDTYDHPDNRGWMNLYKRWSWCGMFRVTWAICAGTYGARFQAFCERRMGLTLGSVEVKVSTLAWNGSVDDLARHAIVDRVALGLNFTEAKLFLELGRALQGELRANEPLVLLSFALVVANPYSGTSTLDPARFGFGFALARELPAEGNATQLVYFRVRDHLRKTGLARRALSELVTTQGLRMATSVAPVVLAAGQDNLDPEENRREFEQLFRSVVNEARWG